MCCDPSPGSHAIKNCGQDWPCPCKHNFEARSRNHYCRGKAVNIRYYECLSAGFVIHQVKRMCHVLSSVACLPAAVFQKLGSTERSPGVRRDENAYWRS